MEGLPLSRWSVSMAVGHFPGLLTDVGGSTVKGVNSGQLGLGPIRGD